MDEDKILKLDEVLALHHAKRVRKFYSLIIAFFICASVYTFINYQAFDDIAFNRIGFYGLAALGIYIIGYGVQVFGLIDFMGPDWERKVVEKKLGRKL